MTHQSIDRVLTFVIGLIAIFVLISLIMLGRSYLRFYSEITPEQHEKVVQIQEEVPEISPMVEEIYSDDIVTEQEYIHIVNVSNGIKRRRLFGK